MDLKGSKTENNLMAAFAGESMARNIHFLHQLQMRQVISRLQIFLE